MDYTCAMLYIVLKVEIMELSSSGEEPHDNPTEPLMKKKKKVLTFLNLLY